MALSKTRVTVDVIGGSTTPITVTGFGFIPKLLYAEWTRLNTVGVSTSAALDHGWGWAGATWQWAQVLSITDARTTTAQAGSSIDNRALIIEGNAAGGVLSGRLSVTLDADGFTLTVDDATNNSFKVDVWAFGGSSIDVLGAEQASPSVSGNFDLSVGTGLNPTLLMCGFAGSRHSAANSWQSTGGAWIGRGAATGPSARHYAVFGEDNGPTTTQGRSRIGTDALMRAHNQGTLEWSIDVVSFGADTITLNKSGSDVSRTGRFGWVAIRVDEAWVGTFTTQTATGPYDVTAPGFPAKAAWFSARADATASEGSQATGAGANSMSTGIAISATERAAYWHHSEGGIVLPTPTEVYNGRQTTRVLMDYDRTAANTATLIGESDYLGEIPTGFQLDQLDADAQATLVLAAVFGESAGGGATLVGGGLMATKTSGLVRAA